MPEKEGKLQVKRIDGRLHEIHDVRDAAGTLLTQLVTPLKVEVKLDDIAQLVVGALALGVPVALAEEVWNLGDELSPGRILLIAITSIIILAFFVYSLFYRGKGHEYRGEFAKRVALAYGITLVVSLVILIMIDKAPFDDFGLALRRAVIIALPASFAATAVDFMK